jgi:hypothetical protein
MKARQALISSIAGLAVTGAVVLANSVAGAQVPSNAPSPRPTQRINLTVEQRHVIKEIIIKDLKIKEAAQPNAPGAVGETVPAGVVLHPIPVEVSAKVPQVRTHSFFVKDNHVIVVDPKDNRIAEVVN